LVKLAAVVSNLAEVLWSVYLPVEREDFIVDYFFGVWCRPRCCEKGDLPDIIINITEKLIFNTNKCA